jgi:ferredoxin
MSSLITPQDTSTTQEQTFRVDLQTPEGLRSINCRNDQYIWDAAASQGVELPAICHQGRCLTCAGKLLSGSVDSREANQYFPEDEAAAFVLLCRGMPRSDCRILTHQEWQMRAHRLQLGLPAPYA